LEGLASWLEGGALRSLLGGNEVAYRRWQERVALAAVDDGVQLAPLSQARSCARVLACAAAALGWVWGR
jgi:hypothetical protein